VVKINTSDKIAKLTEQREEHKKQLKILKESTRKQLEESEKKIKEHTNKLASQVGHLALARNLDKLGQKKLVEIFDKIAIEHHLL
jgi:hypothetical protein